VCPALAEREDSDFIKLDCLNQIEQAQELLLRLPGQATMKVLRNAISGIA